MIPLAAVGVMFVIKLNGTVVAYNRYIKMTNSGRLHALNVGMSSRAAGRALARERKRRTDALANSTDRVFDSNAYVAHADRVHRVRNGVPDAARKAEI